MPKKYTYELSEAEIDLIIISLNHSREWLEDQKGQLTGALIGFSKIDKICKAIDNLIMKIDKITKTV